MPAKIIVVEDDLDIAELLEFNLLRKGFSVTVETNGLKAFDQIRENPPDLILLDITLPGISGIEICKYIRQSTQTKAIPVIMLTARTQEKDKAAGLAAGADAFITKPFSIKEVFETITDFRPIG